VQAGYINDEIGRLREQYPDIPLYAVISDICASGGYYIAVAADHIYADKASIVGSIGVLMDGFGFVEAMNKLGIERRLLTAGEHKGFLDPFSPMNNMEKQHITTLLGNIHQQFIATVKKGRGDRLSKDENLFSGLVWTGEQSVAMGLVDGLGSSSYVAREVIGAEKIVDFTHRAPLLERFVERLGVAMANTVASMAGKIR
jgi:protease-4